MGIGEAIGVGASVLGGMLGKKGGSSEAEQTTSTGTNAPWQPMQNYIVGGTQTRRLKSGVTPIYSTTGGATSQNEDGSIRQYDPSGSGEQSLMNPESDYETTGTPGIADEAARLYGQSGWNGQQQGLLDQYGQNLAGRNAGYDAINRGALGMMGGNLDASVQRVGNISGPQQIMPATMQGASVQGAPTIETSQVSSQGVDARGAIDSTGAGGAVNQVLSGQVNNPYLAGMQRAATGTAMNQYNDAVQGAEQSLNYNILPGLRSQAVGAGQYGGSRQGIAEGLATGLQQQQLGRNARDLGIASMNAGSNLYGNAYQQAQGNMATMANNFAGLGVSNAQANAGRDLQAQTTNAGNGLSASSQNAANALQAQLFNAGSQNQAQQYSMANSMQAQQANAANTLATQQANAGIGFQNNAQALQGSQQQVANRMNGLNMLGNVYGMQDTGYQNQQAAAQYPNSYDWQQLGRYQGSIQPLAGMGNYSTQSQPYYTNQMGNMIGGASAGLGLGRQLAGSFGGSSSPSNQGNDMWDSYSGFDNPDNYG